MEQEQCVVCLDPKSLVVTNCCGQFIHYECFEKCLKCDDKRTCPHCRVYCCCQPKCFANKKEYETLYQALGVPLLYRLTRVQGQTGFSFYHEHCDLSMEEMIALAKSRDWIQLNKDEEERQAARAAERQRRGEAREEEMYVFTLRFANTLEEAEAGQRAENVNEDEWQRLQRITGSPRVSTPPPGWQAMRQADRQQHTTTTTTERLLQAVTETLQEYNIGYEIYRPE